MEGGNGLQANVVGCLTPSPRITKSLNPSPIPDPVFMHVLIKIIKPVNIGDQSHLIVVRPICHVHEHAGAHTHTHLHMFTQYVHPSPQHTKKRDFIEPMGVGVGKYKINPQSSKIDRRKNNTKIKLYFFWRWHQGSHQSTSRCFPLHSLSLSLLLCLSPLYGQLHCSQCIIPLELLHIIHQPRPIKTARIGPLSPLLFRVRDAVLPGVRDLVTILHEMEPGKSGWIPSRMVYNSPYFLLRRPGQ